MLKEDEPKHEARFAKFVEIGFDAEKLDEMFSGTPTALW